MATVKFDSKNVAILGKTQVAEGTPASPVAADAMAVIDLSAEVTYETESYEYMGDSLSREEFTTLKDNFADIPFQTLMPSLGTLNPALLPADAPLHDWLEACNVGITVDVLGNVTYSNNIEVNKLLTIDYFKSSPEVSVGGTAKRQRFTDCRGMLDIAFETGLRALLDFKFLGNDTDPTMETNVIPDLGNQLTDIASVVRLSTVQALTLTEVLGTQPILGITNIIGSGTEITVDFDANHNRVAGETILIAGTTNFDGEFVIASVTDVNTLVLISDISAIAETAGTGTAIKGSPVPISVSQGTFANFFGFDYTRYLVTGIEGFSKKAIPTDVSVVMLEDEVGGTDFNPEANITKFFEFTLKWGTGAGNYTTLFYEKLQLINSKDTEIGSFQAKEVSFRNTGISSITLG